MTYSIFPDPFQWYSFYELPRTTANSTHYGFNEVEKSKHVDTYCRQNDFRMCLFFDKKGNIAGLQVAATVQELDNSKQPLVLEETKFWNRIDFLGKEVWATQILFVNPEILARGGREMDVDTPTAPDGVWLRKRDCDPLLKESYVLTGTNGGSATTVGFTRQGCLNKMGRHYFYNLTVDSDCQDQEPYFLLMDETTNNLHGMGVLSFGKVKPTERDWFERPPAFITDVIAPRKPKCTKEWISTYGAFSMHIYFREDPKSISC